MSVGTGTIVDGVDHLVGFVYADDTYPFINKKYIQENRLPDYTDNKNAYYVTTNKKDKNPYALHLKYYESSLYDDTIIEYHSFHFDDPLLAQSTSFNVYLAGAKGVDWTQIKSDIQLLLLDDNLLLNVTEELPIAMEIKGEKVQQQWNILLFLSAMLFVFMIVYFTHRCKEVGIRKLNGNRFYTIYQKLFLPFVYMVMLSYIGMYGFLT